MAYKMKITDEVTRHYKNYQHHILIISIRRLRKSRPGWVLATRAINYTVSKFFLTVKDHKINFLGGTFVLPNKPPTNTEVGIIN